MDLVPLRMQSQLVAAPAHCHLATYQLVHLLNCFATNELASCFLVWSTSSRGLLSAPIVISRLAIWRARLALPWQLTAHHQAMWFNFLSLVS